MVVQKIRKSGSICRTWNAPAVNFEIEYFLNEETEGALTAIVIDGFP